MMKVRAAVQGGLFICICASGLYKQNRVNVFFVSFTRLSNATQQVALLFVVLVEVDPSGATRRPSCSPKIARKTVARVKMMQQQTRPVQTLELEAADKDANSDPES